MENQTLSLEERVARLEGALGWISSPPPLEPVLTAGALALSTGAAYCAFEGLGLPNHYYQWVLGFLTVFLMYHRGWLRKGKGPWLYVLGLVNAVQVSMIFKLFIGSGFRKPFSWFHYPALGQRTTEGKWWEMMPDLSMMWQPTPLAAWEIDLTLIQTFLLIVTLVGALFRFQPFVSLTAIFLILVSIPAFSEFQWSFVFPAVVLSALSLYLQARTSMGVWRPGLVEPT